jgi:4-alpha-glucanotransferase
MRLPRASGILLHPTSLPGKFGIGDLGPLAFAFVDRLAGAGQTYWQILPLGPTGYGDSPYQCFSAFAGNTLLISPELLVNGGIVDDDDLVDLPSGPSDRVDFSAVQKWKAELLAKAYNRFRRSVDGELRHEYEDFCQANSIWLEDYALYRALKNSQSLKPWYEWPHRLKLRDERTIEIAKKQLAPQMESERFYQFLFFRQWTALKKYANDKGIKIIGDVPIFIALDSSDVWCHQDQFKLSADGSAKVVAGVPPDYFSKTGQLWGNPIYDWDAMKRDGFQWWITRFKATLEIVDIARVDHFRGFAAAWEVPGGDETAENGHWVPVPGHELFTAVRNALGDLPLIAEDLGVITADVTSLRDEFGFPGMRILQYAFGGDAKNHDLPHNFIHNCVAYTGTHDNDTAVGWWSSKSGAGSTRDSRAIDHEHEYCLRYLNTDGREINWDMIRAVWSSVADTAIASLQDVLGLGNEARMNLPASTSGNWTWRFTGDAITDAAVERLNILTETYGRK